MINGREERYYPFHNATEQKTIQDAFNAKLEKNKAAGEKAAQTGEHGVFTGFERKNMDHLFVIELQLDPETASEIKNRVTDPIKRIAEGLGIGDKVIVAGEGDQAAHVTLHVAKFQNMSDESQEKIRKWLAEATENPNEEGNEQHMSHLSWTNEILSGLHFKMDTVFNSGRDTSICAGTVDGENQGAAYRVRKIFERVLERAQAKFAMVDESKSENEREKIGQHYPRYDDIFHTTVARFTGKVGAETLAAFNRRVEKVVGTNLTHHPIDIHIGNARTIIATQGVEERKPSILI